MVFRFYGKVFSEKDLMKKLKTNKDIGTQHQAMIDLAREEGFYVYVNNESSFEEIEFLLEKNLPVIVNFIEPDSDEGHYAVVIGINDEKIILDNPWNSKNHKLDWDDFQKRWHNEKGNSKRWLMVVSNEYCHLGKQYLPK